MRRGITGRRAVLFALWIGGRGHSSDAWTAAVSADHGPYDRGRVHWRGADVWLGCGAGTRADGDRAVLLRRAGCGGLSGWMDRHSRGAISDAGHVSSTGFGDVSSAGSGRVSPGWTGRRIVVGVWSDGTRRRVFMNSEPGSRLFFFTPHLSIIVIGFLSRSG